VKYDLPGGGRGFTRVPSLISAWSTAPFLLNNSVGPFDPSPSVDARMRVFQASIEQMLWPERREKDPVFGSENRSGVGHIDRTTADSYIWVPEGYIPTALRPLVGIGRRVFPFLFTTATSGSDRFRKASRPACSATSICSPRTSRSASG
jgi:hypothetical protein